MIGEKTKGEARRMKPWMVGVFDKFLATLPPLVAIIQHINFTHCLEAKPRLSHLPPRLH